MLEAKKVLQEKREGTKLQSSSVHWFWFLVRVSLVEELQVAGRQGLCRLEGRRGGREGGRRRRVCVGWPGVLPPPGRALCPSNVLLHSALPVLSSPGQLITETDWSL